MFDFCKNGLNFTTPPNDGDVITIDAMLEYPLMEHDSGLMISGDSTYDPTW